MPNHQSTNPSIYQSFATLILNLIKNILLIKLIEPPPPYWTFYQREFVSRGFFENSSILAGTGFPNIHDLSFTNCCVNQIQLEQQARTQLPVLDVSALQGFDNLQVTPSHFFISILDFGPKILFFIWDPVFWYRGVRNPRRWLRFSNLCNFSFPSYARFREGTRPTRQKVFPHPTVGAPSASNSPSALSARAGKLLK